MGRRPKTKDPADADALAAQADFQARAEKSANDLIDNMWENQDKTIDLAETTLTGDLRDAILNRVRYEQDKRPWDERSEADQQMTIAAVETFCRTLVKRAVEIISAAGRKAIKARLTKVTIKDGIKGEIEVSPFDEMRHALADSVNTSIVLFVADPEVFEGERAPARIKPDQRTLGDTILGGAQHSAGDDNHQDFDSPDDPHREGAEESELEENPLG